VKVPGLEASSFLPEHPIIRPHLTAVVFAGEGLLVYGREKTHVFEGSVFELLPDLLDGRSPAAVAEALAEQFERAEVFFALGRMAAAGVLASASLQDTGDAAAFWSSLGYTASSVCANLELRLQVADPRLEGEWRAILEGWGVKIHDKALLTLVVARDHLEDWLAPLNLAALSERQPWLLCSAGRYGMACGPLFVPGSTACWECLRARLALNRPIELAAARSGRRTATSVYGTPPWTMAVLQGFAMVQVARYLASGSAGPPEGVLLAIDPLAVQVRRHPVMRRPQCSVCGDPEIYRQRAKRPVSLARRSAPLTTAGGLRQIEPATTVAAWAHLIDPLTGVVNELLPLCSSGAVHVYSAGLNLARPASDLTGLRQTLRRASGGKGLTATEAQASALGEAIERHCAAYQGDEPRLRVSLEELGSQAVHPNEYMLFSQAQLAGMGGGARHPVLQVNSAETLDWTPLWSLSRSGWKYLPTACLYLGYEAATGQPGAPADSNGNAAGNTLEEAILQGLLELVERDATAVWWYNRVRRPALDLEGCGIEACKAIQDHYHDRGREIWALDIQTDLGIPVVVACSSQGRGPGEALLMGLGAHLDPGIALVRALCEMNQMLTALDLLQEGGTADPALADWLERATLQENQHLQPLPGERRQLGAVQRFCSGSLEGDIQQCVAALEARGLEVLVLDMSRPDIGVPVVRVAVPGLRHFRPRFAPGRLFDVPVRLGWLSMVHSEGELNPRPFVL
jgi:ribosomal protein S12 methylthiotransferase accessory factor